MPQSPLFPNETVLFFKRWIDNPKRLGTFSPISKRLADVAANCIKSPEAVKLVEIGAGPGRLTKSLLKHGVKPENLKAIELDSDLCQFGQKACPSVEFIQGDAQNLKALLPDTWIGNVDIVFSTIPFLYLPVEIRVSLAEAAFSVLKPQGDFFHLTYYHGAPLEYPFYMQKRVASLWWNFPPGFVWRYQRRLMREAA